MQAACSAHQTAGDGLFTSRFSKLATGELTAALREELRSHNQDPTAYTPLAAAEQPIPFVC
jgi:hypothetical protein